MALRFVRPETVRVPVGDDPNDWIEVKKELTAGERAKMSGAALRVMRPATTDAQGAVVTPAAFEMDSVALKFSRIAAYVTGWSSDRDYGASAVQALDDATVDAIDKALDAHIAAVEEEKKVRAGTSKTATPSPSADGSSAPTPISSRRPKVS